jgi:hypothetical protein
MKITIEVDCTAIEARQLAGLPNVEPFLASIMAKLDETISAEIDRFSSRALVWNWFSVFPQNTDWVQKMFAQPSSPRRGTGTPIAGT